MEPFLRLITVRKGKWEFAKHKACERLVAMLSDIKTAPNDGAECAGLVLLTAS
jgi:hypothetical protein